MAGRIRACICQSSRALIFAVRIPRRAGGACSRLFSCLESCSDMTQGLIWEVTGRMLVGN
jgi:hypothetical protein